MSTPPPSLTDLASYTEVTAAAMYCRLQMDGVLPSLHNWCPYSPSEKQLVLLAGDYEEALYGGAVGGGKTGLLIMAALKYVDNPRYRALILRCSYPALKEPEGILDQMREWLEGTGAKWNGADMEWKFPSGAIIRFGHLSHDKALERYIGGGYHFVGFDQLEQFTQHQYQFIFSRLRKRVLTSDIPLRIYSTANPSVEAEWIYEYFINPELAKFDGKFTYRMAHVGARGKTRESIFVPADFYDNPGIDHDSYLESLDHLDEVIRQQAMGDWTVRPTGDIYPYVPTHQVITRSEFKKIFGVDYIPEEWPVINGLDCGASEDHLSALSWIATAPKNSPLPGAVFIFGERVLKHPTPDDLAYAVLNFEKLGGRHRHVIARKGSHEALTERQILGEKFKLHYSGALPSKINGIAAVRYYMTLIDLDKPHPFRPKLTGHPRMYMLVEDGQGELRINPNPRKPDEKYFVAPAINEDGLKMTRAQFATWKWVGKEPSNKFNDVMDAIRNCAMYLPAPKGSTTNQKKEAELPSRLQIQTIEQEANPVTREQLMLRRSIEIAIMAKVKAKTRSKIIAPVWSRNFQTRG